MPSNRTCPINLHSPHSKSRRISLNTVLHYNCLSPPSHAAGYSWIGLSAPTTLVHLESRIGIPCTHLDLIYLPCSKRRPQPLSVRILRESRPEVCFSAQDASR